MFESSRRCCLFLTALHCPGLALASLHTLCAGAKHKGLQLRNSRFYPLITQAWTILLISLFPRMRRFGGFMGEPAAISSFNTTQLSQAPHAPAAQFHVGVSAVSRLGYPALRRQSRSHEASSWPATTETYPALCLSAR